MDALSDYTTSFIAQMCLVPFFVVLTWAFVATVIHMLGIVRSHD